MSQETNINKQSDTKDLKSIFFNLFDLHRDKENAIQTIESLKQDVDLTGTKFWILVCAILIASLGLNVNSNPVIIGAMLISPLMGPIIGFGLGLGIYDFELIKSSIRNLVLTALFSIITATIYFLITPLSQAQSELLARTNPTIFDVGIAFVGGVAGILASSSKSKGNVIPGVAIATALMPPLCTAGYGLAMWNFKYFGGAIFLFIINSVFIAFSTYIYVKVMKFPKKQFVDKEKEKKIHRIVIAILIAVIIPSSYISYNIVRDSYIKDSAYKFIAEHFDTDEHPVVKQNIEFRDSIYRAEVLLMGSGIDSIKTDSILKLRTKELKKVHFVVNHNFSSYGDEKKMSIGKIRSLVLQDFYENSEKIILSQKKTIDSLKSIISEMDNISNISRHIDKEIKILYPSIVSAVVLPVNENDENSKEKKVYKVLINSIHRFSQKDNLRIEEWIKCKMEKDNVDVIINYINQRK